MGQFFEEGGVGMLPTLVFGFAMVAASVMSIGRAERRWLSLVLGALTATSGLFGAVLGLINTMRYVARPDVADAVRIAATGVAESLNNLVLACLLVLVALLVSAVAAFRHTRAVAS